MSDTERNDPPAEDSGTDESAKPTGFDALGLAPEILRTISDMGYEKPSPIQEQSIPVVLSGVDMVGIAQTGSGKTAAFGLPILQLIDPQLHHPQAIVVCPTRELAVQVQRALEDFSKGLGRGRDGTVRMATLYGGAPYDKQVRDLKGGAQVVVGTPGRIMDHLKQGLLKPGEIRMAVLDEADRMLDMGFRDDMETLLSKMPSDRQTLFFSATMNPAVTRLIKTFSRDPEWIEVESESRAADTVEQCHYDLRWQSKPEVLFRLLEMDPPNQAIIFCNTKRVVDECTEALMSNGFPVDRLHGDMTQPMRERVLRRFRSGQISILVATDVAGRGLDIAAVDLVVNYDLPRDPEDYVHRIGRTGRAGRAGRALSLISKRELRLLRQIENYAGLKIPRAVIPGRKEILERRAEQLLETIREDLAVSRIEGPAPGSDTLAKLLKPWPKKAAEGEEEEAKAITEGQEKVSEVPEDKEEATEAPSSPEVDSTPAADWEEIAKALFGLWAGASSREIEPIAEDRDRNFKQVRQNDRSDQSYGDREDRGRQRSERGRGDRGRGDRGRGRGDRGGFRDRDRGDREDRRQSRSDRGGDRGDRREPRSERGGDRGRNSDRFDRGDRDRDPRHGDSVPDGIRRVFIGLGKIENLRPGELAGMLYNEAAAPDGVIGRIQVFNKHTLVDVDEAWADKVVRAARGARYRGKPFRIRFDEYTG